MLKQWKKLGIAVLSCGIALASQALPPWQGKDPILPKPLEFRIPQGKYNAAHSVEIPSIVPKDGMAVILRFDAKAICKGEDGGWNPWFSVSLNGRDISKLNSDGMPRLLRRGESMLSSIEPPKEWMTSLGEFTRFLMFFAPEDATEPDRRILSAREEGFTYTVDITDMLNYSTIGADDRIEGGDPNKFTFTYWLGEGDAKCGPLAVWNMQLFYLPESELIKQGGIVLTEFKPTKPVAEIKANGGSIAVSAQGGLTIQSNQESFCLESHYSYPADPKMKFHNFTVGASEADDAFQVTVKSAADGSVTVQGKAAEYQITRTLTPNGHRVEVRDVIRNLGKEDLGIVWNHTIGRSGTPVDNQSRLAGQSGSNRVDFFGTSNPSLFAAGKNGSVGLLAEDTVSRAQMTMSRAGNLLRMGSAGLGIPKGEEVTLNWVIYVRPEGDYYDFVNQVRKDWKVNYTIDGPFTFNNGIVKSASVRPMHPWYQYLSKDIMTDEDYAKQLLPKAEAARKSNPKVKVLGMLETNLVEFDVRTVPWGEKLNPRRQTERSGPGIKYGQFMSPEVTKEFDAVSPYRDSVVRDRDGNAMFDNYYPQYPFVDLMVQVEDGNERYKQFMRQIDFMMDTLKLNGVYIDQFIPYTVGGFSENRWDGRTVALNDAGRIERKRYSYAITGAPARAEIIRKVRAKGGIVVTNGQPASQEEQSSGVIAFQEMENDPINPRAYLNVKPPECKWQTVGHLGTPIVLGLRPDRYGAPEEGVYPRFLTKGIITGLRNGVVYYYYGVGITLEPGPNHGSTGICDNMFPFTPKALHEGWVEGEERTITAISGTYAIGGKNKPTVLSFDKNGIEKPNKFAVTGTPGNWQVEVKLDDWNEVAIMIVRD